ncbi:serine hydrolase [Enterococcus sp. LJL128]|uniref:serine hydrolase n=1 Tax=Enterococcus sp. LJL51 TaxID=3416656 RepID=UPI003CE7DF81
MKKIKGVRLLLGLLGLGILLAGAMYWRLQLPDKTATISTTESSREPQVSSVQSTEVSTTKAIEASSETIESSTESSSNQAEPEAVFHTRVSQIANESVSHLTGKKGIYVADVNQVADIYLENSDSPIRAASIIKLFLMDMFYYQVQAGLLQLDTSYALKASDKVGGSGVIQQMAEGSLFTYEELVNYMITVSDNTASNILLDILGGTGTVNQFIQQQGYLNTRFERRFLDTAALASGLDNYTSAGDVGRLLTAIYHKQAVSPVYDQQMLMVLAGGQNRTKLPAQIGAEVTVYNKTGEYSEYGVQSDACIFEKNGKAYILVILSQDGNEGEQFPAMNQFGLAIYNEYLSAD